MHGLIEQSHNTKCQTSKSCYGRGKQKQSDHIEERGKLLDPLRTQMTVRDQFESVVEEMNDWPAGQNDYEKEHEECDAAVDEAEVEGSRESDHRVRKIEDRLHYDR